MLFSSIPFLYYFLPIVLMVYFLVPRSWQNAVLLLSSLFFYGWGEPKHLALMATSILLFYLFGLAVARSRRKKVWLAVSVISGTALLGVFKYADFFVESVNGLTGLSIPLLHLALPIGISFYLFQCVSYVVDVYRGDVTVQKNLLKFGTYVSMFPQLIAGPIVRYADVAPQLDSRNTSWNDFAEGLSRFLIGLGKKVLLANQFGALIRAFRACESQSVLFYWVYALAFTLHIYFDFSGYSDMAIGLGKILGFSFPENFRYPYCSKTVTEFWRRWHISLGTWFRDYVYIPLGGSRCSKGKWARNVLIVWMLTGLWHGAAWNFVLWGLLFALLLMAEKWLPGLSKWPGWLRHSLTLLLVMLSFVVFNADGPSGVRSDFAGLLGLSGLPGVTAETLYHLRSNLVLFAVGILGATPLPKTLAGKLPEKFRSLAEPLFLLALLLLCTAYLVDGSYNPFLYFRF